LQTWHTFSFSAPFLTCWTTSRPLLAAEHNTLNARMEQCFIVATALFFGRRVRIKIQLRAPAALSAPVGREARALL
ncbi:MAG TPA: hypothetical protein VFH15_10150, partial [Pyrinomonadaceae bacterium]|nr:hypothetical protein [Pyrinomonadaceae bacterium]